jgi:hypothetical protein
MSLLFNKKSHRLEHAMKKFLSKTMLLSICLMTFYAHAQQPERVILSTNQQLISIDPATLEITWSKDDSFISINQAGLQINGQAQSASKVERINPHSAKWVLQPSMIMVRVNFDEALVIKFDVNGSKNITRNKPIRLTWFNADEAATDTLIIPFSEGMRIPTDNKMWSRYLTKHYSGASTTQSLKMPFWTLAQGNSFVSYFLANATNGSLFFPDLDSTTTARIDMHASRDFTVLNKNESFEVHISLGDEVLSGAKYYRQWRKQQQQQVTLATKLSSNPNIEKLIGASHVYLFGRNLLATQDVTDWWGLKDWYFQHGLLKPTSAAIKELMPLEKGKGWLNHYQKRLLVESINESLNTYHPASSNTSEPHDIKAQFEAASIRKKWLADHASAYLAPQHSWGQGLSSKMIRILQSAHLEKLWIGLDNWMPAFYQPDVVALSKNAGYLFGVYDSYNTAIVPASNSNWLSAHLPSSMRKNCAIENVDGNKQKGFRGQGFYLNPLCHKEFVKNRISEVIRYGQFNSYFLDVDATSMVREDYSQHSKGTSQSKMLEGFNDRMLYTAKQNVVLGSEDGNGLTSQGLAFAHGLETVGFGWEDPDMKTNRNSPYFLGAWYPDAKPAFFFKTAKVKEPYKTLYFSPQFRLPLYQAVFHDEIINSHHWHSDSLKFSDVQVERDLTAMLYNTPAMVHLSRDDFASINTPRIKALKHYQSGFLPAHTHLWDKALVGFTWLDKQGLIQQTRFDDGSVIIANFSSSDFTLAKHEDHTTNVKVEAGSVLFMLSGKKSFVWHAQ